MLRILAFFLVVLAAGLGFAWLADNPGTVNVVWQGQAVGTTFTVFVILQLLLVAAAILLVWLLRGFFKAPDRVGRYFRTRRRDKGYRALSSGIVAAGAGDAATARRMTRQAHKLLGERREPMLRFLDAQTALIEGDHARARSLFETMERDPETRLVGLRGLFLEAERLGDKTAAHNYAERAVRIAPHVPWAGGAVLDLKAAQGDYDGALAILEAQRDSRLVDKAESRRLRAVLLTAKAQSLADADPAGAKKAAREAGKLAPDFAPAALVAARAMIRQDDLRGAGRVLEAAWQAEPNPQVAALYIHARPADGVAERLKRARTLASMHPSHVESHMAMAQAAFDASEFALARIEATRVVEKAPRESAFLLLADIEDAESGNDALVRGWMNRALTAPRDPSWAADGVESAEWAPVSPVSGRLDAFRWTVPTARPGASLERLEAGAANRLGHSVRHEAQDGATPPPATAAGSHAEAERAPA